MPLKHPRKYHRHNVVPHVVFLVDELHHPPAVAERRLLVRTPTRRSAVHRKRHPQLRRRRPQWLIRCPVVPAKQRTLRNRNAGKSQRCRPPKLSHPIRHNVHVHHCHPLNPIWIRGAELRQPVVVRSEHRRKQVCRRNQPRLQPHRGVHHSSRHLVQFHVRNVGVRVVPAPSDLLVHPLNPDALRRLEPPPRLRVRPYDAKADAIVCVPPIEPSLPHHPRRSIPIRDVDEPLPQVRRLHHVRVRRHQPVSGLSFHFLGHANLQPGRFTFHAPSSHNMGIINPDFRTGPCDSSSSSPSPTGRKAKALESST